MTPKAQDVKEIVILSLIFLKCLMFLLMEHPIACLNPHLLGRVDYNPLIFKYIYTDNSIQYLGIINPCILTTIYISLFFLIYKVTKSYSLLTINYFGSFSLWFFLLYVYPLNPFVKVTIIEISQLMSYLRLILNSWPFNCANYGDIGNPYRMTQL